MGPHSLRLQHNFRIESSLNYPFGRDIGHPARVARRNEGKPAVTEKTPSHDQRRLKLRLGGTGKGARPIHPGRPRPVLG